MSEKIFKNLKIQDQLIIMESFQVLMEEVDEIYYMWCEEQLNIDDELQKSAALKFVVKIRNITEPWGASCRNEITTKNGIWKRHGNKHVYLLGKHICHI